jgi:signal transduction histidine kinase
MADWKTRKEFLLLSEEEEKALQALQPMMTRHVDELVNGFYRHLLGFAETRKLLSDELITSRLIAAQKKYLLSLVTGPYDQDYQEGRLMIGQVHERIGLTPEWYLGAYSLYLNLVRPLILEEFRNRPALLEEIMSALTKVIFLDIQLAIEAYIRKSSEKLEFANRQLAEMSRELERGLTKKKKDLQDTQEQLRYTERLAELGTLASGMAHEIGTPMNVILGRAEYLMDRSQDEAIKGGLQTIIAQVERITKIMNQLLTFARRRPSDRRPIDLRQVIGDTLEIFQERLRKHAIHVISDYQDCEALVLADPDQISQVLLNLIMNAIHAMQKGGSLRVRLEQGDGKLHLMVIDTGHGIPQEHLSKIFLPFFTTKDVGKGTGLGLTVVHGIVQEHGGTIEVESHPGHGTTFTITLPIYQKP